MSEWRQEGEALVRDLKFKDFAEAMAYVDRVADTKNDHEMARRIDEV